MLSTGSAAILLEDSKSAILNVRQNSKTSSRKSTSTKEFGGGGRRGRMDLIAEILLFCEKKRVKTCIMSETNVNYMRLKKYLNFLTVKGLLSHSFGQYSTTDKGRRFLELFTRLNGMMDSEKVWCVLQTQIIDGTLNYFMYLSFLSYYLEYFSSDGTLQVIRLFPSFSFNHTFSQISSG